MVKKMYTRLRQLLAIAIVLTEVNRKKKIEKHVDQRKHPSLKGVTTTGGRSKQCKRKSKPIKTVQQVFLGFISN